MGKNAFMLAGVVYGILFLCHDVESVYDIIDAAYPTPELRTCGGIDVEGAVGKAKKKIIDLTHEMRPTLPIFGGSEPVGTVTELVTSMNDGSDYNLSELKMGVHTGTHLDAPGHFVNELYEAGYDVNGLDLDILIGIEEFEEELELACDIYRKTKLLANREESPALLVDVQRDSNITAKALESLNIPMGVQRVLFRTANTDKRLMWNPVFDSSFIGFTEDGADWLVTHRPHVKLVGTDYLSVAAFSHNKKAHRIFLWQAFAGNAFLENEFLPTLLLLDVT